MSIRKKAFRLFVLSGEAFIAVSFLLRGIVGNDLVCVGGELIIHSTVHANVGFFKGGSYE